MAGFICLPSSVWRNLRWWQKPQSTHDISLTFWTGGVRVGLFPDKIQNKADVPWTWLSTGCQQLPLPRGTGLEADNGVTLCDRHGSHLGLGLGNTCDNNKIPCSSAPAPGRQTMSCCTSNQCPQAYGQWWLVNGGHWLMKTAATQTLLQEMTHGPAARTVVRWQHSADRCFGGWPWPYSSQGRSCFSDGIFLFPIA